MVGENLLANISGTNLGFDNSHIVSMTLLCGVSGTQVIPITVNTAGNLISLLYATSGTGIFPTLCTSTGRLFAVSGA